MRTEANASSTTTRDFDWVKVALQANTRYRIVWDVACLHEGIIYTIFRQLQGSHDGPNSQFRAKRTVGAPTSPSNSRRPSAGTTSLASAPEGPTSLKWPQQPATRSRASGAPSRSSASPSRRTTLRSPRGATRRRAQGGRDPHRGHRRHPHRARHVESDRASRGNSYRACDPPPSGNSAQPPPVEIRTAERAEPEPRR